MASTTRSAPAAAPISGPAREAWVALFGLQRSVIREVERRLHAAGLPPLAWYDVLFALYRDDECSLYQRELAERIMFSPSGLSRLLDRMVARGVVRRHQVPGDRRAASLSVTEEGVALMRRIWEHYGGVLAEHFLPAIEGHESELAEMLTAAGCSLEAARGQPAADG